VQFHFSDEDLTQQKLAMREKEIVLRFKFGDHLEQFKYCYMIALPDISSNKLFYVMCREFVELLFKGRVI
jgi:hypothetical protein